ncbi:MAG TPA: hypothetical protein VHB21_27190, partial [Minicystis sp.]|nr:hypothetical protein [Minicystis sp.]
DDGLVGHVVVRAPGGGVVYDARPTDRFESYDARWCGDLDGDGDPELAITHSSGGAHCCTTEIVVTLAARPTLRLRYEAGNAGGLRPAELDGAPPFELLSSDDALTELDDVPFALAKELPVVFALDRGRYVRRTARFPSLLLRARAAAERDLAACGDDAPCRLASLDEIAGLGVLLGDAQAARRRLSLSPEAARSFDDAARALQVILRRRGEPLP